MAGSKQLIELLVLDPADFSPLPLQPGFAQLVQDELGDVATPADGFDDVLAEAVGIVDALAGALDSLGGELLDAFAEADLVDPAAARGARRTTTTERNAEVRGRPVPWWDRLRATGDRVCATAECRRHSVHGTQRFIRAEHAHSVDRYPRCDRNGVSAGLVCYADHLRAR